VLGVLGEKPHFVSTQFGGELGQMVADVLTANQVNWQPLAVQAPFSLFEAHIDSADQVFAESFIEGESLTRLTPEILHCQAVIANANVLVGCTNLSVEAMTALADIAQENNRPFWLLTSSNAEVPRIRDLLNRIDQHESGPIALLSLNREELQLLVNRSLETLPDIAAAAIAITASVGHCLVTLGSRGALLAAHGVQYVHYQPVAPISGRSPVGGGDVMFASLLAAKIQGQAWAEALTYAAVCTRHYLLRDKHSSTPYAVLHTMRAPEANLLTVLPPIEKVFLNHDR
jgi:sugar/nucleoside kinase (ribokinase family)